MNFLFRFPNTNRMGLVSANNIAELYWVIYEFGDPMGAEYAKIADQGFGVCYELDSDMDSDGELLNNQLVSDQFWNMFAFTEKREWKKFNRTY